MEAVVRSALRAVGHRLGLHSLEIDSFDTDYKALQLIQIYRLLHHLTGTDEGAVHWLRTYNKHLQAVPSDIMLENGLERILSYLEHMAETSGS